MQKQILETAIAVLRNDGWCTDTRGMDAQGNYIDGENPAAVKRCVLGALDWGYAQVKNIPWEGNEFPGEGDSDPLYQGIVCGLVDLLNLPTDSNPAPLYATPFHKYLGALADWNNAQADGSLVIEALESLAASYAVASS